MKLKLVVAVKELVLIPTVFVAWDDTVLITFAFLGFFLEMEIGEN